tara:strand:+ start:1248 stop:1910 length:663 start_codon:yes stop_codon:yes gene_type:complete
MNHSRVQTSSPSTSTKSDSQKANGQSPSATEQRDFERSLREAKEKDSKNSKAKTNDKQKEASASEQITAIMGKLHKDPDGGSANHNSALSPGDKLLQGIGQISVKAQSMNIDATSQAQTKMSTAHDTGSIANKITEHLQSLSTPNIKNMTLLVNSQTKLSLTIQNGCLNIHFTHGSITTQQKIELEEKLKKKLPEVGRVNVTGGDYFKHPSNPLRQENEV